MSDWKNYGDVNFVEYGGTLVRKAFDETQTQRYPQLDTIYDVFHMYREGSAIYAFMGSVDVTDFNPHELDINRQEDAELLAVRVVDEIGFGGCNAFSLHSQYPTMPLDLIIEEEELTKWLSDIGFNPAMEAEKRFEQNREEMEVSNFQSSLEAETPSVPNALSEADVMERADAYLKHFMEQVNSEYPTILPYGLEISGRLNVNDIQNVPTYARDNRYISYTVLDGEKWYYDSCDNLQRLCDNAKLYDKTVMDNPIYGMSERTIERVMSQCMEQQGEEYMKGYLSTAHNLYETAKASEAKGIPFPMPSDKIARVIEQREGRAQYKEEAKQKIEQRKAKNTIERD